VLRTEEHFHRFIAFFDIQAGTVLTLSNGLSSATSAAQSPMAGISVILQKMPSLFGQHGISLSTF